MSIRGPGQGWTSSVASYLHDPGSGLMARRFSSGQCLAQSDALSDKDLEVFPAAPVICDRTP
jgi:hypothetical protein